ncbi:hypothetical protein DCMF_20030 [Candidatus Formimonas warabiya]|uniref:Antitoxin SocA-like Panacea domain-containing protein n=1 Tax=Formimonas warabiya TaxID=1761012 RepID=A0A3G1L274_FORW1|nr:hypothetical protein DCMF_20030 [Candidatus Formimonas warabiya]
MISKLAKMSQGGTMQFGKTAVMKYLFILQEVFKVPCGYSFSLYTYGPYCADVLSDLDYTEAIDGVKIYNIGSGYSIEPSQKAEEYIKKAKDFLNKNEGSINEVMELFSKMTARDLELRSTIIYIYKNYLSNRWEISSTDIAADVRELKPHFTFEEVLRAFDQLKILKIFNKLKS